MYASITRSHRTAFILAIDQSGSMAEKLLFRGRQTTKAEAVAEVTNRLLFELIERARRSDEVRDYYDIAVLGYSGDGIVSLLNDPEPLVPVSRLAAPARRFLQKRSWSAACRTAKPPSARFRCRPGSLRKPSARHPCTKRCCKSAT